MNWGYKILIVYAVFVAGIVFMVYKSSNEKMDLVTADYYGKELKFQQQIDETKRTDALSETVRYVIKGNQLLIYFPKDFAGKTLSGDAELYYPADENKDIHQHFDLADSALTIPVTKGNKGLHELHINWKADGTSYYFEQKIII